MFIVDFDDTIFDSQKFKLARCEVLLELGVSEQQFWHTYKQARIGADGTFTYNDKRHAQFLALEGFDEDKIYEKLASVTLRINDFLFHDTLDFLTFLKEYKRPVILLSLGDPVFQETKVLGTKIHNYFDKMFMVARSKGDVLKEIFKYENPSKVWFLNDKVEETKYVCEQFENLVPVLKVSSAISMDDYEQSGLPYFKTLTEIKDYVAKSI